jgi:hypothetical protein
MNVNMYLVRRNRLPIVDSKPCINQHHKNDANVVLEFTEKHLRPLITLNLYEIFLFENLKERRS